jgi:hypothetical protein
MNKMLHRNAQWVDRTIRGRRLLIPTGTQAAQLASLYGLNETAAAVLDGTVAGRTADRIAADLAAEYNVPEAQARQDVETVLAELVDLGVLTHGESGA